MIFTKELVVLLATHAYSACFIAGFLSEDILLLLALLSDPTHIPFTVVFLFGFLGIMVHDSLIFFIARSSWLFPLRSYFSRIAHRYTRVIRVIEYFGKRNPLIPLTLSKFIYGTRIPLALYAASHEKKFVRYTFFNGLAVLIWCIIMVPIGLLAGKGFLSFLQIVRGAEKIIGLIILLIILLYLSNKLICHLIFRRKKNVHEHSIGP